MNSNQSTNFVGSPGKVPKENRYISNNIFERFVNVKSFDEIKDNINFNNNIIVKNHNNISNSNSYYCNLKFDIDNNTEITYKTVINNDTEFDNKTEIDNKNKLLFISPEVESYGLEVNNFNNIKFISLIINKEKMRYSEELKIFYNYIKSLKYKIFNLLIKNDNWKNFGFSKFSEELFEVFFYDNLLTKKKRNNYTLKLKINENTKVFCNKTKKIIDINIDNLNFRNKYKFIIDLDGIYCFNNKICLVLVANTIIINEKTKKIKFLIKEEDNDYIF